MSIWNIWKKREHFFFQTPDIEKSSLANSAKKKIELLRQRFLHEKSNFSHFTNYNSNGITQLHFNVYGKYLFDSPVVLIFWLNPRLEQQNETLTPFRLFFYLVKCEWRLVWIEILNVRTLPNFLTIALFPHRFDIYWKSTPCCRSWMNFVKSYQRAYTGWDRHTFWVIGATFKISRRAAHSEYGAW